VHGEGGGGERGRKGGKKEQGRRRRGEGGEEEERMEYELRSIVTNNTICKMAHIQLKFHNLVTIISRLSNPNILVQENTMIL